MGYFRFKKKHDFYKRLDESYRIKNKYPDKVPIIVEKHKGYDDIPDIDRNKYLVPNDITMAEFMYVIRKRIHISPEKSIYLFVENLGLVPTSLHIQQVYDQAQDKDGFLYIKYCGESTFG
jgi:GABA(A) receptor-associated protein